MKAPVFPKEFLKHCPKVDEAKVFYSRFSDRNEKFDESEFAECEFTQAGSGLECQSCKIFLTRPFLHHEFDKKWLPILERYYKDSAAYAEYLEKEEVGKESALYSFVPWPEESKFDVEVFDLFRQMSERIAMSFTENGFKSFRSSLRKNGIMLKEVECERNEL